MASEKPESGGFLAIIDAKIAALQQLRDSLIAAMSIGALGGDLDISQLGSVGVAVNGGNSAPAAKGPIDLPTGVFRGQGVRRHPGVSRDGKAQADLPGDQGRSH